MEKKNTPKIRTGILLGAAAVLVSTFGQQVLLGQVTESDTTLTESGTVVEVQQLTLAEVQKQVAAQQWQERIERTENYREEMLKAGSLIESMQIVQKVTREKRAELRARCREEIRKASKYTKLDVSETCYAEELELEQELLIKEKDYIQNIPGISADIRSLAETRINLLYDAIGVVVNAIYSKVYESTAELEEVKAALLVNYREPKWLMDVRLQADGLLTRTSSVIIRIGQIAENEEANPATSKALLETLVCFTNAEILLKNTVRSSTLPEVIEKFENAKKALVECNETMRVAAENLEAPTAKTDTVETSSGETIIVEDTGPEDVILHGSASVSRNGRTATDVTRIHGLTNENYVEATYKKTLIDTEGYQVEGPTSEPCDLEEQDRVLQGSINVPCRIHSNEYLKNRGFVPTYYKEVEPEPEHVFKVRPEPKESITGPSPSNCDLESLPRRLLRRIVGNNCRINEELDLSDRGFKPSAYRKQD